MTKNEKVVYCDFCEKSQYKVAHLVQGPKDVAICNECTNLCIEIIEEAESKEKA